MRLGEESSPRRRWRVGARTVANVLSAQCQELTERLLRAPNWSGHRTTTGSGNFECIARLARAKNRQEAPFGVHSISSAVGGSSAEFSAKNCQHFVVFSFFGELTCARWPDISLEIEWPCASQVVLFFWWPFWSCHFFVLHRLGVSVVLTPSTLKTILCSIWWESIMLLIISAFRCFAIWLFAQNTPKYACGTRQYCAIWRSIANDPRMGLGQTDRADCRVAS